MKRFVIGPKGLLVAALAVCAVAAAGRPAAADPISDKYNSLAQWQRDMLGRPTTGYVIVPGGTFGSAAFQEFQGGAIYWDFSPGSGPVFMLGTYWKWKETGGAQGPLGHPTADETPAGDNRGAFARFKWGFICWSPQFGFREVNGAISFKYEEMGGILGARGVRLGYPVTDELGCQDGRGRYNHFEGGSIYWTKETDAHAVHGPIRDKWASMGWQTSSVGYPTSEVYAIAGGGIRQDFERGFLYQLPGFPVQQGNGSAPRVEWVQGSTKALPYSRDGVDLGPSTVHNDTLYIFYGDGPRADFADPIGFIRQPTGFVSDLASLGGTNSVIGDGTGWFPFRIRYPSGEVFVLGQDQTPGGAFSYDGKCYVFTGHRGIPVLTSSSDPWASRGVFDIKGVMDKTIFMQVAPMVVKNAEIAGLPKTDARDALIMLAQWDLGYNKGSVIRLAWMPLRPGKDPNTREVLYYSAAAGNPPSWSPNPKEAQSLVSLPKFWSAISVGQIPRTGQWILLYQKTLGDDPNNPRPWDRHEGIYARIGSTPWNWSQEVCIFHPDRERAWGNFMVDEPGGGFAYGAHLLSPYTEWNPAEQTVKIRYLMSTYKPYRVVVMESTIKIHN